MRSRSKRQPGRTLGWNEDEVRAIPRESHARQPGGQLSKGSDQHASGARNDPNLGPLDEFLGFRLRRLETVLSRDFGARTSGRSLRSGFASTLAIIAGNPTLSQRDLARETSLDKSVIALLVDEMVRLGLVQRERSQLDRRRLSLSISPEGESFLNEIMGEISLVERAVLGSMSKEERAFLFAVLDRIFVVARQSIDDREAEVSRHIIDQGVSHAVSD